MSSHKNSSGNSAANAATATKSRDYFTTPVGFILASIGSAVGMANIWLFPYRTAQFGGAAFLVAYVICILLVGLSGVVEEITLGRTTQRGPIGAFRRAFDERGFNPKIGEAIGLIPALATLLVAIGYSVVMAWIIRYLVGSVTGSALPASADAAGGYFGAIASAYSAIPWHIAIFIILGIITVLGIAKGIEKVNKVLIIAFFFLFLGLAVYVSTLPNAGKGYEFLFNPVWSDLLNPMTWVYALGQSFFSLSLAGSGTVVYGSYLKGDEDVVKCAGNIAIFDTLASLLAVLVIMPAVFSFGAELTAGPGLMFIAMPQVFESMPFGQLIMLIFFVAVFFAGLTSLLNLFEAPIEALQDKFNFSRKAAVITVLGVGLLVGLNIQGIVGEWMDFVSIYMIPLGALCAAIIFFYIFPDDKALAGLNSGREGKAPITKTFMRYGRFVVVPAIVLIAVLNLVFQGIG